MTEITQVRMSAFSERVDNIRNPSGKDMKTFVAGTAIKFTMIINSASATAQIDIWDPQTTTIVDNEEMTKEADYVYSYVYQTPSDDVYTGKWIITYKVTEGGITMLTQDRFTLITQNP